MTGDVVRLIAAWLADGTHGVAALLPSVPRDVGHSAPTAPTIAEETTDPRLGRGRIPESGYPLLLVSAEMTTVIDQDVVTDDGYFATTVRITYAAKDASPAATKRDGGYVLRAVAWSIRRLLRQDANAAGRLKNSIALIRIGPLVLDPWDEQLNDGTVIGGLTLQLTARDYFSL